MAILNFKATESDAPGGGVYKVGTGSQVTIKQSDYPEVNLSNMTANNFFKKTVCLASDRAQINTDGFIAGQYTGGNTTLSYSYSNGIGTVTVGEKYRGCYIKNSNGAYQERSAGYNHTIYMSRQPII